MANIFAILTVVALAASAFFAFKNKDAYEQEITQRQRAESDLQSSQGRLTGLQQDLSETESEHATVKSETEGLGETKVGEESKLTSIKSEIETKRSTSEANAERIEEIEDQTRQFGEVRELAGRIKRLQEEITGLEDEKVGYEIQRSNALATKSATDTQIEEYNDINTRIRRPESYFSSARVSAIYPQWGFVTLGSGVSSGVVAGSTLNVIRGDEIVGKLRVRSVEDNRASADVIPDSLLEGVSVRVGDRVVPAPDEQVQASN